MCLGDKGTQIWSAAAFSCGPYRLCKEWLTAIAYLESERLLARSIVHRRWPAKLLRFEAGRAGLLMW